LGSETRLNQSEPNPRGRVREDGTVEVLCFHCSGILGFESPRKGRRDEKSYVACVGRVEALDATLPTEAFNPFETSRV
jgi:hypothetical protein